MMTTEGDTLTEAAEAMLSAPHVFPVLLAASPETLKAWEERQRDRRFPYERDNLGGANTREITEQALRLTHQFLHNKAQAGTWQAWAVKEDLPWRPAESHIHRQGEQAYLDPAVGDYLINTAYSLAIKIANPKRHALHFAEHSLLWIFRPKLPSPSRAGAALHSARMPKDWCDFLESGAVNWSPRREKG